MARWITAKCPTCNTNTLDVQVGRKSTVRTVRCPLCGNVFGYSAWTVREGNGVTVDQVDLIKLEAK